MEKRIVKKTREELSPIGFGAMRLPSKNGKINYKESEKLIHHAIDNGINIIDTAAIYNNGESEKFLGKALKGEYRNKVKISTKLPAMNIKKYEDMEKILNEQLERLQIDCIDYYFLHNVDLKAMNRLLKKDVLKFLSKAKQEGKIKYVGFSYHGTTEEFPLLLDAYDWDMVMIQYNYFDNNVQADIEGIHHAASKGMGIFVMEPLKGGTLVNIPEDASKILTSYNPDLSLASWGIRFAASLEGVLTVLSGVSSLEQLEDNLSYMKDFNPLTEDELKVIGDVVEIIKHSIAIPCTGCDYCLDACPEDIPISKFFALYNDVKQSIELQFLHYFYYDNLAKKNAPASSCLECGECEENCTQHIKIIDELKKVRDLLEVDLESML